MSRLALLVLSLLLPSLAAAQDIVADLSQNRVSITTSFDGSELLVFGAIRRGGTEREEEDVDVIVTLEGPQHPVTVREAERRAGIWVNTESFDIAAAPAVYRIATSHPLDDILTDGSDLVHRVTVERVIRTGGIPDHFEQAGEFIDALVRIREASGLYAMQEGTVQIAEQSLFRTTFELPSSIEEGNYRVRIFLLREGRVVTQLERLVGVRKVGIERFVYNLSQEQPLVYGILAVIIAVVAGWAASAAFGRRG
ncbi:TIGR02186 family protein [Tropicimonas sp. IMCC34011]|uniref:TIGR02186 family protein n=1 Tax=Tropicimonas sp. IMCC34011 TaxID=2248759 RepID=UPI000E254423|nr:TIGR02186 family protein [Tropicimonas sp. IMCC34011]